MIFYQNYSLRSAISRLLTLFLEKYRVFAVLLFGSLLRFLAVFLGFIAGKISTLAETLASSKYCAQVQPDVQGQILDSADLLAEEMRGPVDLTKQIILVVLDTPIGKLQQAYLQNAMHNLEQVDNIIDSRWYQ